MPDLAAIDHYLTLQYVPAPQTAFAGIRKLPAAHYLTVAAAADGGIGEPELVRYWRLPRRLASRSRARCANSAPNWSPISKRRCDCA